MTPRVRTFVVLPEVLPVEVRTMGSVGDTISLSIGKRRGMKMTMKLSRIAVAAVLLFL